MFNAPVAEVSQKRIPRAERQETQSWRSIGCRLWKESVDDLVRRTVTADRDKVPDAASVSFAGNCGCLTSRSGFGCLDLNSAGTQAIEGGTKQLPGLSAPGSRVHYC
jgi:hypothetical protein